MKASQTRVPLMIRIQNCYTTIARQEPPSHLLFLGFKKLGEDQELRQNGSVCRPLRLSQIPVAILVERGDDATRMSSPTQSDEVNEATPPPSKRTAIAAPDFSGTPQPIGEFAGRADFPQCAHGVYIDIQGFAGVVVEIIGQSIKIRSFEGITQRFNVNRLIALYGPAVRPEPFAAAMRVGEKPGNPPTVAETASVPEKPGNPARLYVADPDFAAPIQSIKEYACRPDFPRCAFGKHVEIEGYTGVVVELVKGSMKIRSAAGITRSYNARVLNKNYGAGNTIDG